MKGRDHPRAGGRQRLILARAGAQRSGDERVAGERSERGTGEAARAHVELSLSLSPGPAGMILSCFT